MPVKNRIKYYQYSVDEAVKNLETSIKGLSESEFNERLNIYGQNKLKIKHKEPLLFKLLHQFKDLMVIILIVAGCISLYLGEYRDTVIMFSIVFINAVIGFVQEYKAEKTMDALKTMVSSKAKVVRDGHEMEIKGEDVVPGDILLLEEGDAIPADVRLIEEHNFYTNDFSLTGESNPVKKFTHPISMQVGLGDRNNISFMGTTVATGNAKGVVVATGMDTEIGRIANLSQQTEDELSPLQKELNNLAKNLTIVTIAIGALLFVVGLVLQFTLREAFLFALGVAASCVPEGLPAQVSIALSLAAGRLAKEKAIIKKLSAVETLGSTHIICTDKTGTLTKNEMTVQKLFIGGKEINVSGIGYNPEGQLMKENNTPLSEEEISNLRIFFETGVFASNAHISEPDKEHPDWYAIGDPTEAALITLAAKAEVNQQKLEEKYPEIVEFTFDAGRKLMSSIRNKDGKYSAYVKGSPQALIEKCTHIWDGQNIRPITNEDKELIKHKDDENAMLAMRNLGYAYKELSDYKENIGIEEVENDLIWLGLISMIDPPREEVQEAVDMALKSFIRIIIITGDYALTAEAIARKIGMGKGTKEKAITVITSKELHKFSDIELIHNLIHSNLIFARTSPEDKLRIVGLLKRAGEIVAVTGDGVNDAPALKKADIGVAMGRTGTDVAKNSAEIILLDDSFATLVTAVEEGRTIFRNLTKTIMSSLTSNGGELFAVLLSLVLTGLLGYPLAILAVQILAIDLVGEMLPLTFLTWDPPDKELMKSPPRNPNEHILNKKNLIDIAWSGLIMGTLAFGNFLLVFFREGVSPSSVGAEDLVYLRATTITYLSIVLIQWFNILARRTAENKSVATSYLWSNKRLLMGYLISFIFLLNITYNPFISHFLHTGPLTFIDWVFAFMAGFIYLLITEFKKGRKRMILAAQEIAKQN